jgi:uncharacterized protein YndB with AHSA1/START domain
MTTFSTSREIAAPVAQVFAAIADPQRLARWWGPAGFTNTFNVCEFKNGGRWSFVMHGPDGTDYANESVFAEIEAPHKVVVQHESEPRFRLTISLGAIGRRARCCRGRRRLRVPRWQAVLSTLWCRPTSRIWIG